MLELFVIGAVTFAGLCCWKLANDAAPTAASVTLVFALEVPMGLAAQWACFGERPAAADGAGAALILLATCLPEKWMARLMMRPARVAARSPRASGRGMANIDPADFAHMIPIYGVTSLVLRA